MLHSSKKIDRQDLFIQFGEKQCAEFTKWLIENGYTSDVKPHDLELTVFTRDNGKLSKRIKLANGTLVATPAAAMTSGRARRVQVAGVHDLAALIEQLNSHQALSLGTLRVGLLDDVEITTKAKLDGQKRNDLIARTNDALVYREGCPAFVLFDYDSKGKPSEVSVADFWKTLVKVLPGLKSAAHVIRRSTSSGLFRSDTGEKLPGSDGRHIFVVAKDGSDSARFLTTLHQRCWLAGYGWLWIDKAGRLHERSIIDRSVGAPERLVFEAPPVLTKPLQQDAESRKPVATDGNVVDTLAVCPPLMQAEQTRFNKLVAEAKARIQPEADKVRAAYVEERVQLLIKRGMSKEAATQVAESQCEGVLLPDVELEFVNKDLKGCTVGDVLDDPERFEGEVLADPVEGADYGHTTAKVYCRCDDDNRPWIKTPWIKSFAHGGTSYSLVREVEAPSPPPSPQTLADVHAVFRKWFGDEYDLDVIDAVCATAASERLTGDPLWLLLISGPGATKTETVSTLAGAGAHIISTIASEGALLSASPKKGRAKNATGGLLRKIGEHGILVIKDVTTILSMARETRASVLAAIREIYDGRWERNVGSDGGQSLSWTGRITIVGACTTAWDSAHAVVAAMGDRFVILRIDSNFGRKTSGQRAVRNTGAEVQMREELATVVGGLVTNASTEQTVMTESEEIQLLAAADIVTLARTAVERDYRGDVAHAHMPEMPTRFTKQLVQMIRGGVAIGMSREDAMKLAIRCARDSIPPLRLEVLIDIATNPSSRTVDVRRRITKPWSTTKREIDALHLLGLLACEEEEAEEKEDAEGNKSKKSIWLFSLAPTLDRKTLLAMAGITDTSAAFMTTAQPKPSDGGARRIVQF